MQIQVLNPQLFESTGIYDDSHVQHVFKCPCYVKSLRLYKGNLYVEFCKL